MHVAANSHQLQQLALVGLEKAWGVPAGPHDTGVTRQNNLWRPRAALEKERNRVLFLEVRRRREKDIDGVGDTEHAAVGGPPRALIEAAAVAIALKTVGGEDAIPGVGRPHFEGVVLAHGHDVLGVTRGRGENGAQRIPRHAADPGGVALERVNGLLLLQRPHEDLAVYAARAEESAVRTP